jgi:hypothetical protein
MYSAVSVIPTFPSPHLSESLPSAVDIEREQWTHDAIYLARSTKEKWLRRDER